MDSVTVKLKQDLVPMDDGNGEEQVKSRSMNQFRRRSYSGEGGASRARCGAKERCSAGEEK